MSQEITVTKVEDHYEMQFDGGNSYPAPENAIETLADDLTPDEVGGSVTFVGDYGGHKHAKTFDVEEVVDDLDNDDEDDDVQEEGEDDEMDVDADDSEPELERIETTDEKPGVDTATIREGDVLEQVTGDEAGARFRVEDESHMGGLGGDGGALTVEHVGGTESRRENIVDNGTGALFEPVEEA